jgi:Putative peptidoglycan binding domain
VRFWTRLAALGVLAAVIAAVLGLVFAGSPDKLADGTRIAGVDVGGLTAADAGRLLQRRSDSLTKVPVTFVVGAHRFRLAPRAHGIQVDWRQAVKTAERQGGGFGIVRGYRRLELEFFPEDLVPPIRANEAGLSYEIGLLGSAVDTPHREAKLVRRGLHITIASGSTGHVLDRAAARQLIVRALASFSRDPSACLCASTPRPSPSLHSPPPSRRPRGSFRRRSPSWQARLGFGFHAGASRNCSISRACT